MFEIKSIYSGFLKFVFGLVLILAGFFSGIVFLTNNNLITGYKVLMVQSGSMEPTIMTGDVIVVKKSQEYSVGDVISFTDDHSRKVTHRIASVSPDLVRGFVTKGDANRTEDNAVVPLISIIGKVIYTIPGLGYFIVFAKKPIGIVILIIVPCVLILLDELIGLIFPKKQRQ
ncbi:MAG: signal peptidase I [bacterium]|nr:signal peptidase I [bacterium]